MSGSLEVRQFLMRHDGANAAPSGSGVPTQRMGGSDAGRISDEQVHRARLAVANGARGAEDCALLLDMLGLAPGEDGSSPVQH
jgi:hypothetical protein